MFIRVVEAGLIGGVGHPRRQNLVGTQYSLIGSSGYWAQLGWQPISALLIIKVPTRILMTYGSPLNTTEHAKLKVLAATVSRSSAGGLPLVEWPLPASS
jgi:hypothetical protein